MTYLLFFFTGSCHFIACNDKADTSTSALDTTDTAIATYTIDTGTSDTTPIPAIPSPEGIYQVRLPCTDCKAIEHTVLFNAYHTFRLEEARLEEKDKSISQITGTWQPTDSVIWLYEGQLAKARYTWQGKILQFIDVTTGKHFAMQKLSSALDNKVWRDKKETGKEFFGIGNEPFWNIEIDEQKSIAFHLAEWSQPLHFKPSEPVVSPDSTVYNTSNDTAVLRIVIYNRFCNDGMSDYTYNNEVKVLYNEQAYLGCGIRY